MFRRLRTPRSLTLVVLVMAISTVTGAPSAVALPADFVDEVVFGGLSTPTNVEFAPNGKVFVTEKGGKIKVFDSLNDPTPDVFADLSANVHDFWDRGMLGLAVHPDFPNTPYVYVTYTYGVPLDPSLPTWGDGCPTPPGSTTDGCVVSGRLSRLEANGNQMTGPEMVLINDWCQQYPSHSIGDLEFGADGALYVSAGDGASFGRVDYGQLGGTLPDTPTPVNPCGDPANEGGALRSQDLRTDGDPVSLDGTVLRIDPDTGLAAAGNPLIGHPDLNARRIVANGLRNPYRMAFEPSTGELYIGDVGWSTWEEVNVHPDPAQTVRNYGWPCYEGGPSGSQSQSGYDNQDLAVCETLYSSGSVEAPLYAYQHGVAIPGDEPCPGSGSAIAGLAFYQGGTYPGSFTGALFGADYNRGCIWVMYPDGKGNPDPATVEVFQSQASNPVDLEALPGGDLFYVDINFSQPNGGGAVHRIRYTGGNNPPIAVISAFPLSGPAPLTVDFDASGSFDPDADALSYGWDLDDDGQFDDGTGTQAQGTYNTPGGHVARLRVTDARGESDTESVVIQASNSPPTAVIDSPLSTLTWRVGDSIGFSGHGTDPEEGLLPATALDWKATVYHCDDHGCDVHGIQLFPGTASGQTDAPDHEYPTWIELQLTATDQYGASDTTSIRLDPETVELTFNTDPQGLGMTVGGQAVTTPRIETAIVGSVFTIGVNSPQNAYGETWYFDSWSDGGAASHDVTTPQVDRTYTATFTTTPPPPSGGGGGGGGGGGVLGLSVSTFDDTAGNIHEANIELIAAAGITRGCNPPDNNLYCPDRPVTRAEIAAFVIRALGIEDSELLAYQGTFSDVPEGEWFGGYVETLAARGIINGYGDGTYRPGAFMTRAEMAAVMMRAFGSGTVLLAQGVFDDVPVTIWYALAVEQIYADKITLGCGTDPIRYCPDDLVLRDQMASYLARALGLAAGAGAS